MNLREFNTLKQGDKVENAMTNGEGTVTAVQQDRTGRTVKVKWGAGPGSVEFSYLTHSTAWMHWYGPLCGVCGVVLENIASCPVPHCKHLPEYFVPKSPENG